MRTLWRGPVHLTILAAAVLALGVPAADAASVRTGAGGVVLDTTGDGDRVDSITISPATTNADGVVLRWRLSIANCGSSILGVPGCIGSVGDGCTVSGDVAVCDRLADGITVRTGGGADAVSILATGDDRVTAELGAGNDVIETFGDPDTGLRVSTGPWTVDAGAGNDLIVGSGGGSVLRGGTGDDVIRGFPDKREGATRIPQPFSSGADRLEGGAGNDTLDGGRGADVVLGGDGADVLRAGDEDEGLGGLGGDAYDGGAGRDTVDYSQRTRGLFVDSGSTAGGRTEGDPDENDRISGVERVLGGAGGDVFLSLSEPILNRAYDGGAGDDTIAGGSSNDEITGGPGIDTLNGGSGNDVLRARDGVADRRISCGAGRDFVDLDLRDPAPSDQLRSCEEVQRRAVAEAAVVRLAGARAARGGVRVTLACPRANDRACAGTLSAAGRRAGYRLARGASRAVAVPGAVATRGGTLVVTSVERGRLGAKTVIARLRVG